MHLYKYYNKTCNNKMCWKLNILQYYVMEIICLPIFENAIMSLNRIATHTQIVSALDEYIIHPLK